MTAPQKSGSAADGAVSVLRASLKNLDLPSELFYFLPEAGNQERIADFCLAPANGKKC